MPKYTDIEVNREIYLFVEVFLRPRFVNLPSLRLYKIHVNINIKCKQLICHKCAS